MRKLILLFVMTLLLFSCTENARVRVFGGEGTLNVPQGQKVVNVTWKETDLWILTRPMTAKDSAETYTFSESSSWGLLEGTLTLVEKK
jgi:hypothetical protein